MVKHLLTIRVQALGWEDLLEKEMATHSSILAWKIAWTEEPGTLKPTGSKESDMNEQLSVHTCRSNRIPNSPSPLLYQQSGLFSKNTTQL